MPTAPRRQAREPTQEGFAGSDGGDSDPCPPQAGFRMEPRSSALPGGLGTLGRSWMRDDDQCASAAIARKSMPQCPARGICNLRPWPENGGAGEGVMSVGQSTPGSRRPGQGAALGVRCSAAGAAASSRSTWLPNDDGMRRRRSMHGGRGGVSASPLARSSGHESLAHLHTGHGIRRAMVGTHVSTHILADLAAPDDDGRLWPPGTWKCDPLAHGIIRTGQQAGQTRDVRLEFIDLLGKDGCRHVHPQVVHGETSTSAVASRTRPGAWPEA